MGETGDSRDDRERASALSPQLDGSTDECNRDHGDVREAHRLIVESPLTLICRLLMVIEHLLDGRLEEPGELECQRQRRDVPPDLDRVHRLTGHAELSRQVTL